MCTRGLSRAHGAKERSVDKRQEPARQLGKTPYQDIAFRFQAAVFMKAAPVETEALAVVVARCMHHAHSMHMAGYHSGQHARTMAHTHLATIAKEDDTNACGKWRCARALSASLDRGTAQR